MWHDLPVWQMSNVVFYASEITSAIAHMHTHKFVHRDIKASNIVLDANGHAKLIDLGCSKQLEISGGEEGGEGGGEGGWRRKSNGDVGVTCGGCYENTYTYCGTPHCMAPEMISREGHGLAVDWW